MPISKLKSLMFLMWFAVHFFLFSCQASDLTAISTRSPIAVSPTSVPVDEKRFVKALNNKKYLSDCRNLYPPAYDRQIGYHAVYPGRTSTDELQEILGMPQERSILPGSEEEWIYGTIDPGSYFFIYTKSEMVDSVSVIVDAEFFLPLQEILEAYGCPELIVADAKEPDYSIENIVTPAFPDYEFVWFEYITASLSFGFDGYPLSFSDIPVYVNFVTPEFFMEKYKNSIYLYPFPVELRDAVK